jgi:hypothetical protein
MTPIEPGSKVGLSAAASSNSSVNPTFMKTAPFVHDYSTGGKYGNYSVYYYGYGDFRHAGVQDIVTLSTDGILTLMTNDGKGHYANTYSNTSMTATWVNASGAFVADINGDGWPDIVSGDSYSAGYIVWLNKGNGTFADAVRTTVTIPAAMAPTGFTVRTNGFAMGDIDGDGKPDIVIALNIYQYSTTDYRLYLGVLKGNGDGTFQAPVYNSMLNIRAQSQIGSIQLADMHNSGKLDVVVNVWRYTSSSAGVGAFAVATNTGSITPGVIPMPPSSQWVTASMTRGSLFQVVDLDGDGNKDVLSTPGVNNVYLYKGDGAGNFGSGPQTLVTTDTTNYCSTVGDFNRDGYQDMAIFSDGVVNIYNATGYGSFNSYPSHEYPGGLAGSQKAAAVDINNDGNSDFVWADPFDNYLYSYRNNGDGSFSGTSIVVPANISSDEPNSTDQGVDFLVLRQGDYNGDGLTDLLVEEGSSFIDIALNNGKGGFEFHRAINTNTISAFSLASIEPIHADLNGDGYEDLVFSSYSGLVVALSDGKGGIKKMVTSPYPISLACTPGSGAAADIDGDGILDIVIAYSGDAYCYANTTQASGYIVLKGDGTGAFTSSFTATGTNMLKAKLADMNHDGKVDIVLYDGNYNKYTIYAIPGDGTIAPPVSGLTPLYVGKSTIYDFNLTDVNGDGIPDLTVSQYGVSGSTTDTRRGVFNMVGKGDLTFGAKKFLIDGGYAATIDYSDMNHDGYADLVAALYPYSVVFNGLVVVRSDGNGSFETPDYYPVPVNASNYYNSTILPGSYYRVGSHDIALGGGSEYVPGVVFYNAAESAIQFTTDRSSATQGDTVTLTAQLNNFLDNAATGTVVFNNGTTQIASASLNGDLASAGVINLPLGANSLTATYEGDSTHEAVTSLPATVTITAPTGDFTLNAASATLTGSKASGASTQLTLTANSTMSGSVALSCIGLPASYGCTFSPAAVTLAASANQSVTVTVASTKTAQTQNPFASNAKQAMLAGFFLLFGISAIRRRSRLLLMLALVAVFSSISGCGSGSGASTPVALNVTVVAQGTASGKTITHSIPMTITLQ